MEWLEEPTDLECNWSSNANLDTPSSKRWMDDYLGAFALGHGITITTFDKAFTSVKRLKVELLQVYNQEESLTKKRDRLPGRAL